MLKISRSGCLGPSQVISAQFTLEMYVEARNHETFATTPILSVQSRSKSSMLLLPDRLLAQRCGLGRDVSVSRWSRDVLTSRLGLVSDKILNVSVSSRSRRNINFGLGPVGLVSGLGPLRLVETFYAGAPCIL